MVLNARNILRGSAPLWRFESLSLSLCVSIISLLSLSHLSLHLTLSLVVAEQCLLILLVFESLSGPKSPQLYLPSLSSRLVVDCSVALFSVVPGTRLVFSSRGIYV